jgi:hypothetical protein
VYVSAGGRRRASCHPRAAAAALRREVVVRNCHKLKCHPDFAIDWHFPLIFDPPITIVMALNCVAHTRRSSQRRAFCCQHSCAHVGAAAAFASAPRMRFPPNSACRWAARSSGSVQPVELRRSGSGSAATCRVDSSIRSASCRSPWCFASQSRSRPEHFCSANRPCTQPAEALQLAG